jgi:HAMP domain-containing protein
MARRIAATVLALIAALLGLIAVPLGLLTAGQDSQDYQQETTAAAVTLANVAEERIGDHSTGPALDKSVSQLSRGGDQVAVYDAAGSAVAGTARRPVVSGGRLSRALAGSPAAVYPADDRLLVVAPVLRDGGGTVGAVVLSRSAAPLDHRIATLWAWLGGLSAAGLAAAALTSTALAKWVSRPLSSLDAAARELGGGALDTRSGVGTGPVEVRRLAANFNTMAARLEALVHGHQGIWNRYWTTCWPTRSTRFRLAGRSRSPAPFRPPGHALSSPTTGPA